MMVQIYLNIIAMHSVVVVIILLEIANLLGIAWLHVNFLFLTHSYEFKQFSLTIKETVSASTKIPLKQNELDYYMTCPAFKNFLQVQNDRCLKMYKIYFLRFSLSLNNLIEYVLIIL